MGEPLWQLLVFTCLAGAAMPAGGLLARLERVQPRWLETELRHGVIAFGGGVLLSAVSLVLVPEGIRHLSYLPVTICLLGGGALFMMLDRWMASRGGSTPQLAAMLADFVPEALAMGAVFVAEPALGVLLALLIALQNLPEGFNAWRELRARYPTRGNRALLVLIALVPLGPLAGLVGYWWLHGREALTGAIMLLAAGGILYITFQDIAPQARLEKRWGPPLGAVLGFLLGVIGHMLAAP